MSNRTSPLLPSHFLLFPMGGGSEVVDFWSGLFAVSDDARPSALAEFPLITAACLKDMAYRGDTDGSPSVVTFSGGLIGVGRHMLEFRNAHAKAFVYFKPIHDMYYVSLRVVYPQPFSLLKVLWFVGMVVGVTVLVNLLTAILPYSYYYGYDLQAVLRSVGYLVFSPSVWLQALLFSIPFFIGRGVVSWWRTGKFLGFLREDFHEIYRDDLASIGHAAYTAIMTAADVLSLKIIMPEEMPAPAFGATADNNRVRRAKRI